MHLSSRTVVAHIAVIPLCLATVASTTDATEETSTSRGQVAVGGSNTVKPLLEYLSRKARREIQHLQTIAEFSGTGDGFRRLAEGELDLTGASRPIKESEIRRLGGAVYELPVAFDHMLVFVSTENHWVDRVSGDELHAIFVEGVRHWSEVRSGWPEEAIRAEAPEPGSGTTDAFVEFIGGDGDLASSVRRNSDHLETVHRVGVSDDAIGFASAAYLDATDSVRAVPVDLGDGPVAFGEADLENSYPLGRPLLVYVSAESAERAEVAQFVDFVLKHAAEAADATGSSPLPDAVREVTERRWRARELGSVLALGTDATSEVYGGES